MILLAILSDLSGVCQAWRMCLAMDDELKNMTSNHYCPVVDFIKSQIRR